MSMRLLHTLPALVSGRTQSSVCAALPLQLLRALLGRELAETEHCYLFDLAINVKNKQAKRDSKSSVIIPFLPEHRSLQLFSSHGVAFSKLDTLFLVLHH